ncbi:HipA family kinase [Acaryochloris sp. CCMEE 5410]|uniref:HipA family kinase n=1 Tax=Acaryochloris sp. CCMEE 5410 TaxID=310037 RepID=UPI000248457A|nr:HipA family kinase [Acaryochloris sp. CCMEE 5410]KAI9133124.1 hypothetical protein ON05_007195 [Acaryochloris sp. CCMEE 5410]
MQLPIYRAIRIVSAPRCGSSRPIVVETEAGYFLTKLRGAAQGTAALVSEMVVSALAEALGFWVPSQVFISIDASTQNDIYEDEFLDLLGASHGLNLGFQYLERARDLRPRDIESVDRDWACRVLWLDALVMNRDRTPSNPNLMVCQNQLWVIDHGAALPFQYNWSQVTEEVPRRLNYAMDRHLFGEKATALQQWDLALAAKLSRDVIQDAVAHIPDCFLLPLCRPGAVAEQLERRRQAYGAFLWKRLKFPRPFVPKF